jgi:hypothetical protein
MSTEKKLIHHRDKYPHIIYERSSKGLDGFSWAFYKPHLLVKKVYSAKTMDDVPVEVHFYNTDSSPLEEELEDFFFTRRETIKHAPVYRLYDEETNYRGDYLAIDGDCMGVYFPAGDPLLGICDDFVSLIEKRLPSLKEVQRSSPDTYDGSILFPPQIIDYLDGFPLAPTAVEPFGEQSDGLRLDYENYFAYHGEPYPFIVKKGDDCYKLLRRNLREIFLTSSTQEEFDAKFVPFVDGLVKLKRCFLDSTETVLMDVGDMVATLKMEHDRCLGPKYEKLLFAHPHPYTIHDYYSCVHGHSSSEVGGQYSYAKIVKEIRDNIRTKQYPFFIANWP